ncbi:MAG: disulfide bond formation protein B [Rhodospirillales bacterium]|nr:disulfide bond formation protein B [Rhodospirillales bacterium]
MQPTALRPIHAPLAVLVLCGGALVTAYVAEYGFGLDPCVLCLYQRIPYAIAGAIAGAALALGLRGPILGKVMILCALCFVGESGLAFYHVGVEQHWWQGTAACGGAIGTGLSAAELKAALLAAPPIRCDEIAWKVFGLSITVYNVAVGAAMTVFCLAAARWVTREEDTV